MNTFDELLYWLSSCVCKDEPTDYCGIFWLFIELMRKLHQKRFSLISWDYVEDFMIVVFGVLQGNYEPLINYNYLLRSYCDHSGFWL